LLSSLCALAVAAAIALIVGGCGSSGSSSTAATGGESTAAANGESTAANDESTGGGGESTGTASAGGNKETTAHSSSLSKAEFVKQANAICTREKTKGLEAMGAYAKQHRGAATGQAKIELIGEAIQKVFLPSVQSQVNQIRALGAPAGDEQEVEALLDSLEEAVEKASQGTASSARFGQAFASSGKLAREYGLSDCVYG
jgi:hypothetical protein